MLGHPGDRLFELCMSPLEVYPLSEGPSSFCSVVMPQQVSKGILPYCRQPWNLILHSRISVFAMLLLGCKRLGTLIPVAIR